MGRSSFSQAQRTRFAGILEESLEALAVLDADRLESALEQALLLREMVSNRSSPTLCQDESDWIHGVRSGLRVFAYTVKATAATLAILERLRHSPGEHDVQGPAYGMTGLV